MTSWHVNKSYPAEVQEKFASLEKVLALEEGELVSQESISITTKLQFGKRCFFIKRFVQKDKGLFKYFGRSHFQSEWQSIRLFHRAKIKTLNVVAYGEKKALFGSKPKRGAIVFEAPPGIEDLQRIAQHRPKLFRHELWRAKTLGIVADYVSRLHQRDFIHENLKPKNILVTKDVENPKVYFLSVSSGKNVIGKSYARGVKKDLAHFNKYAELMTTRTERLRFYLIYKIQPRILKKDKNFIRSLLKVYRKQHERVRN